MRPGFVLLVGLVVVTLPRAVSMAAADPPQAARPAPRVIETNRRWEVLPAPRTPAGRREVLAVAGRALGNWTVHLAGVEIRGAQLVALAAASEDEPWPRVVREGLRRAVDPDDLLLFLDDVLRAGDEGLRGELVWVTPGRARKAGILLHPDDVFSDTPRLYREGTIAIDMPRPPADWPPAEDGDPPGPGWTMRYRNPADEEAMLAALAAKPGAAGFAERVRVLIGQLRRQGVEVHLNSTVRSRERGYLMWGAWLLARSRDPASLAHAVARLERANGEWGLDVPISWRHPGGWRATRESAREMADTYDVVYATEDGARASRHYTGEAVDLSAPALPRRLHLVGADGAARTFDLSAWDEPRDLSLTPELIAWIEMHFRLEKLRSDYPHWNDAR